MLEPDETTKMPSSRGAAAVMLVSEMGAQGREEENWEKGNRLGKTLSKALACASSTATLIIFRQDMS